MKINSIENYENILEAHTPYIYTTIYIYKTKENLILMNKFARTSEKEFKLYNITYTHRRPLSSIRHKVGTLHIRQFSFHPPYTKHV